MIFFTVDAPTVRQLSRPKRPVYEFSFVPDTVYLCTYWHLQVFKRSPGAGENDGNIITVNIMDYVSGSELPLNIGFGGLVDTLEKLPDSGAKIGILNGMGRAMGDNLVGMSALRILRCRLEENIAVEMQLFQADPEEVDPICRRGDTVDSAFQLPITLDQFLSLDAYVDLCGKFGTINRLPFIDWFLAAFSILPESVSGREKRNTFKVDKKAAKEIERIVSPLKDQGRPILQIHHRADVRLRSLPQKLAIEWVEQLVDETEFLVVSALALPIQHDRFVDLSSHSRSLDHFAAIISNVDAMISVDTLSYHLADVFDIPAVALLTTIDPELRTIYYPTVEGLLISEKDGPLYGLNSATGGTEQRSAQIELADQNWRDVKLDRVIEALNRVREIHTVSLE